MGDACVGIFFSDGNDVGFASLSGTNVWPWKTLKRCVFMFVSNTLLCTQLELFFYYHYFVIKINVLVLRVFHSCRGSISQVFREMLPVVVLNRTHDSDHTGKVGCRMVCFLTAQLKRGTVLSNSVLFGRLTGDYDWKCLVASFCTFIFFHCLRVRKLTWG